MGDTGSLLIGLISAVMAVKFIEVNKLTSEVRPIIYSAPAIAVAILTGPIFDTLRVFFIRISNGKSPFQADRNHVHHRLLRLGFNHMQTTAMLAAANIFIIFLAFLLADYGNIILIICVAAASILFNLILTYLLRPKEHKNLRLHRLAKRYTGLVHKQKLNNR